MKLNHPDFPVSASPPSLTDKLLGVVGGLVRLVTLEHIKAIIGLTVENSLASDSITNAASVHQVRLVSDALGTKLNAADYNEHFKGVHASLLALNTAIPSASAGDYATLDAGTGSAAHLALWDTDDGVWVDVGTVSLSTTDALTEGSSNLYFTAARAISAVASAFLRFDLAQTLNSTQKAQAHENLGTFVPSTSTKTASYVLDATDSDGKTIIRMNVGSANTVTVNSSLTKPITVRQVGAGITTLVEDGVTLNGNLVFSGANDSKTIIPVSVGVYDVYGAL